MFDIDPRKAAIADLEAKASASDFWDDQNAAKKVLAVLSGHKEVVGQWESANSDLDDLATLFELAREEEASGGDHGLEPEIASSAKALSVVADQLEVEALFTGEHDSSNAIVTVHAGAGGTESQDWAVMLMRMYMRWAEKRGFSTEVDDTSYGDEAGIKSATFIVKGRNAYGFLQGEKGVHRLVRISPFDSAKRRHTSFSSVDVIPDLEDDVEIEIEAKDLRVDTYRASGPGGQHVNKTDSAVRLTHVPTGTVTQCQSERSQMLNREKAMHILRARLYEQQRQQREDEIAGIRGEQKKIEWGSQIRSYVFQPYTMVKDHRTKQEVGNVQGVMDGEINPFVTSYLHFKLKDGGVPIATADEDDEI